MLEMDSVASIVARAELNRTVRDRLLKAIKSPSSNRNISVTDLTNPRQAYFRRVTDPSSPFHDPTLPVAETSLRSKEAMEKGSSFHRDIEPILAEEEFLENVLWLDGQIKGKLDIFHELPIEIKTTSRAMSFEDLPDKVEYLEQLGMYCAMSDKTTGRLLVVILGQGNRPHGVVSADVRFQDIEGIRNEMRRRAKLLQEALERKDASQLPLCPWYGRNCNFQTQGICNCARGQEPFGAEIATRHVAGIDPADDYLKALEKRLVEEAGKRREERKGAPDAVYPSNLLNPRRFVLERLVELPAAADREQAAGELKRLGVRWARDLVANATQHIDGHRYAGVRSLVEGLAGRIGTLDGRPFIVKSTRGKFLEAGIVGRDQPQWVLELALACAGAGTKDGYLILIYELQDDEERRFQVYHIYFRPGVDLQAELRARLAAVFGAFSDPASVRSLPKCLWFMQRDCQFRSSPECCAHTPAATPPSVGTGP